MFIKSLDSSHLTMTCLKKINLRRWGTFYRKSLELRRHVHMFCNRVLFYLVFRLIIGLLTATFQDLIEKLAKTQRLCDRSREEEPSVRERSSEIQSKSERKCVYHVSMGKRAKSFLKELWMRVLWIFSMGLTMIKGHQIQRFILVWIGWH